MPQTSAQQQCINKINKDTIKVQAAQGKANSSCLKDFVNGALGTTVEMCIANDPRGKVLQKQNKTLADEMKKCTVLPMLPNFAYATATTANAAAQQAEIDLMHDIFGNPADNGLFACNSFPNECLCQRQAIDRVEKIFRAMSKLFVKCKKLALAIGHDPFTNGASMSTDIEQCVTNGTIPVSVQADTKQKVSSATTQLGATLTQFCGKPMTMDEFGAGVCMGLTGTPLTDCLAQHAKCRFCKMVNAADNLAIDCATWSGVGGC